MHALASDSRAAEMRARGGGGRGRGRVDGKRGVERSRVGKELGKTWRKEVEVEVEAALDLYLTSGGALT